jgi:methylthioribulose-1-phosphate dehydratase
MDSLFTTLPDECPRTLIPELCRHMYNIGWATGTGGGVSIRSGDKIYIAPSGVQKERIEPEDLFVQTIDGVDVETPPTEKHLKKSQCTPLFMNAYKLRNAGAVIHSHSRASALATLVCPGHELRISHIEMIKGIKRDSTGVNYRYDDVLVVPIIENTPEEHELQDEMARAMNDYPDTCAILVRRHGFYVWGKTWQLAKTMAECYDYLFAMYTDMKQHGIDPTAEPAILPGTYITRVKKTADNVEHNRSGLKDRTQ